jgi:hypothetical protein
MEKHPKEEKNTKHTAKNAVKSLGSIYIGKLYKNNLVDSNVKDVASRDTQHNLIVITPIQVLSLKMFPNLEASPKNFTRRLKNVNSSVLTVID